MWIMEHTSDANIYYWPHRNNWYVEDIIQLSNYSVVPYTMCEYKRVLVF